MFDINKKLLDRTSVVEDGCWMFLGAWDSHQYGIVWYGGHNKGAHIVSYEYHIGPVPKDKFVLHKCDHPWCVNPEHLFVGTKKENYDDMIAKGRGDDCHRRGEDNNTTILTEQQVIEIYSLLDKGLTHTSIAIRYGVARPTITSINSGQNWRHLYERYHQ
jgi:hypothetical protein